jgi:hypothetical protein
VGRYYDDRDPTSQPTKMNAINNLVKDIATKKEKVPKASAAHPLDQDSSTPVVTQVTTPPVD